MFGAGSDQKTFDTMNLNSYLQLNASEIDTADTRPILIVPYMWIGDFVRGHTVVRVLKQRWPNRPVDILTTSLCAPLVDYMPGVRQGIVWNLRRSRLSLASQWALAKRLRAEGYGTALIMPRTWKSAIAPALAGIPQRTGFVGELRFGLVNDWRWGEKALPRLIDKKVALALAPDTRLTMDWPPPQLVVPPAEIEAWRQAQALGQKGSIVALAPGSVGPSKRWTAYPELARQLAEREIDVWVVGGPGEKPLAAEIVRAGGPRVRDLTGTDLRNGILAMAAAGVAISNDSGLMHIAAAIGTPTVGLFGPTSPWHWAPLNPISAIIEAPWRKPGDNDVRNRTTEDIPVDEVFAATMKALLKN